MVRLLLACLTGGTWQVDLGNFASQSLGFLQDSKVP